MGNQITVDVGWMMKITFVLVWCALIKYVIKGG